MIRNQQGIVPSRTAALSARSREKEEASLFSDVLRSALIGLLAAILAGIALITAAAAVAYANPDPGKLITPLSLAALLLTAFSCGFVTAKRAGEAPLLCGIVSGAMLTVLMLLLALILRGIPSAGLSFGTSAMLHGAAVIFSILGAFAGNVKRKIKPGTRRFG